jgi:hypothetical protein
MIENLFIRLLHGLGITFCIPSDESLGFYRPSAHRGLKTVGLPESHSHRGFSPVVKEADA